MARPLRAQTVSLAAGSAGGLLLLASTFLPWSDQGAGSAIALRRVADLVLAGTVDALVPRWAGLVVYLIPLGGALVLMGTGLGGRLGLGVGAAGIVIAVVGTAVAVTTLDRLPRTGVGGGTVAACLGAMLGTLGVGAGWHAHRNPLSRAIDTRGEPRP
ncbi:MAG TPA: hypothetical protein VF228_07835 [Iamia sp.]